ncbi:AbrB family transcriptional regulator [Agrobacterium vitis]|nr:AbrB family transcriptional regulator [Allorhizobium ampelinum]MCF1492158.1 AbrB family transcriptional regulator [Allorhizobium ampelinum]MVA45401.1 AbrB family transcriptional regulator [Agrobacterium vitis]
MALRRRSPYTKPALFNLRHASLQRRIPGSDPARRHDMTPMDTKNTEPALGDGRLTALPSALKWILLLLLSLLVAGALEYVRFPAALLLGPMIAAIVFATNGARLSLPRPPYIAAQALVGCMIAESLNGDILRRFLQDWPLFIGATLSVIALSSLLGYIMAKRQVLPGTTAVWGSSAGAASAMVLMAEAYGADTRLVAFMQYLRVVCVASAAAAMAAFVFNIAGAEPPPLVFFPETDWQALALTLAITAAATAAGHYLKIPAGTMLVPMLVMAVLNSFGLVKIELPLWLLAVAYAMVGWRIGLAFSRRLLLHAAKAAPQVALSILILISFGGCLAFLLWYLLGVDPLTAYLATSPGGLDSVAIIAATTHVDLPFVLALQTARFLMILALGPSISKFIANRIKG